MLIDAHAHLTHPSLQEGLDGLLQRATQAGIEAIVNICTDPEQVEQGLLLANRFPWIYLVAAITPHDAEQANENVFARIETYARKGLLVAIGETGLDYHYFLDSQQIQKKLFCRYLQLAIQCDLPIVVHCREAFTDFFEIIDAEYGGKPGVLHCFTGTVEEAIKIIERGWYLSLSGIVSFKKNQELHKVAQIVPLDRLMLETDAPYLAPIPHRGKTNEPSYLVHTAAFIAELRGISLADLAAATRANTRTFFRI